jgi:hypothetical protein
MIDAFPEAMVTDYEGLEPTLTNDEGDRHVLAAAIVARAQVIVTHNLQDFPPESCEPYGVEVLSPDAFLLDLLAESPDEMLALLQEQAVESRRPPMTVADVLHVLSRSAPLFAQGVDALLPEAR